MKGEGHNYDGCEDETGENELSDREKEREIVRGGKNRKKREDSQNARALVKRATKSGDRQTERGRNKRACFIQTAHQQSTIFLLSFFFKYSLTRMVISKQKGNFSAWWCARAF